MVGLMWPKETGAEGSSTRAKQMCLREAVEFSRCAIRGLAVCTRSSRCTVWLLWQQDTRANMVILNLQNYHSSRRRSNVRAVRSSRAPPAARSSRQIFQCMLCMLSILQGHSRHNIIVMEEGVHLLKTHQGPSVKYLKELNASGISCTAPLTS
jgi:hypothetical protein